MATGREMMDIFFFNQACKHTIAEFFTIVSLYVITKNTER